MSEVYFLYLVIEPKIPTTDTHGEGYTKEVHVLIHTIGGQITDLMGLVF